MEQSARVDREHNVLSRKRGFGESGSPSSSGLLHVLFQIAMRFVRTPQYVNLEILVGKQGGKAKTPLGFVEDYDPAKRNEWFRL